jgi:sulfite reductase (ferredoxin)
MASRATSRSEGQWAAGYREPLNAAEQTKREDDGLSVRRRIETIYAKRGFASIWPSDLRSRMRWYGLYTQRPETDGYFMLRIRVPGGVLTAGSAADSGRTPCSLSGSRRSCARNRSKRS